jgi:type I restriction enzyme S subunit
MRRYEQYAPSGFDWLGDLPSHWSILRAKYVFREIDDRSMAGDEELLSVSHLTGVTPRSEKNVTMFMAEDYTGAKLCKDGDLVINTMWAWMGALGVSRTTGIVSPAYGVYRQLEQRLRPRYMDWLFRTPMYVAEYTRRSTGVNSSRLRLYPDRFLDMPVVIPSLEDQDRIVAFLDQKAAEVDAAIAKKERLIGLLHEQLDIVINQLVRRGLNPAASLKDSCTPWLGPIPSHWRPSRLKFLFSGMEQGWSPQCFNFEAPEGTWGVLKVGCVNGAVFNERENKQLPPSERPIPALQVRVGDILISRANSLELVGSAAFVNQCKGKLLLCDKLYRVHAREDQVLSEYLVLMLRTKTARQWIENGANGASPSMQNIGQDVIKNLLVAVPPLDEQRQILAQVESAREKIGLLENRTRSEIGAMAEMRRILISDAVVGKIKI